MLVTSFDGLPDLCVEEPKLAKKSIGYYYHKHCTFNRELIKILVKFVQSISACSWQFPRYPQVLY